MNLDDIIPVYLTRKQIIKFSLDLYDISESFYYEDEAKFQLMSILDELLKAADLPFEKFLEYKDKTDT